MPFALAAGIGAVGSLVSGLIGSSASKSAAETQAQAATQQEVLQANIYNANVQREQPFVTAGQNALSTLSGKLPELTATFAPTQASLAATPGFQFTQQQGLQATQNAMAGAQPGGAALKSGVNYAEGLAQTTFQQQFQNYLAQNSQIYNMLSGLGTMGANAAAQTGTQAIQSGTNISNLATGGAAASAAGTIGSASALTGGITGGTNALSNAIGLSAISGSLGGSTGSSGGSIFSGVPDSFYNSLTV